MQIDRRTRKQYVRSSWFIDVRCIIQEQQLAQREIDLLKVMKIIIIIIVIMIIIIIMAFQ